MEKRKTVPRRLSGVLAVLACVVSVMAGCGWQKQPGTTARLQRDDFKLEMEKGIEATRAGDLEMARLHIDRARPCAKSFERKRMVESMDALISGAQAMMDGDATQAKNDWANIPDLDLNREIRVNADVVMGVKVPAVPKYREGQALKGY